MDSSGHPQVQAKVEDQANPPYLLPQAGVKWAWARRARSVAAVT